MCSAAGGPATGRAFREACAARFSDAGGGVPGAEVTLTNEQTNVARSTLTNDPGEYAFAAVEPGTYRVKVGAAGLQDDRARRHPRRHAEFLTLDLTLEVGAIEETITVTGQTPLIETANASHGTVLDSRGAADAAVARPRGVPDRHVDADGHPLRRRPVQPAAGSDQRVAALARRRHRAAATTTRSTACRSPTCATAPRANPTHRVARGRQGAGPHLRRGDGPHRRRRVQHHAASRAPTPSAAPASSRRGRSGARPTTTSARRPAGRSPTARTTSAAAASAGRSSGTGRSSGSPPRATTTSRRATSATRVPDRGERARRLLAADQRGRPAGHHLRPADAAAVRRQHHPGAPHQPGRRGDAKYLPLPDIDVDNGSTNYTRTSLINNKFAAGYTVKVEHKFTDSVSLTGFYLYNHTDEPDAELLRQRRSDRADPLRRPERLLPGAAAADPRAEQHLGAERQLGAGAALRLDPRSPTTTR